MPSRLKAVVSKKAAAGRNDRRELTQSPSSHLTSPPGSSHTRQSKQQTAGNEERSEGFPAELHPLLPHSDNISLVSGGTCYLHHSPGLETPRTAAIYQSYYTFIHTKPTPTSLQTHSDLMSRCSVNCGCYTWCYLAFSTLALMNTQM